MAVGQPVAPTMQQQPIFNRPREDAALGVLLGIGGGLAQGGILHSSLMNAALLGGGFGLFSVFSSQSALRPREPDSFGV